MPAQYVKPYMQTNKSDYLDAEAIADAVQRPPAACCGQKEDTVSAAMTKPTGADRFRRRDIGRARHGGLLLG